jgi:hypothetical protein
MHNNNNTIFSLIYDIPCFDLTWTTSGRWLTKENVMTNNVTVVELYYFAAGGIIIVNT